MVDQTREQTYYDAGQRCLVQYKRWYLDDLTDIRGSNRSRSAVFYRSCGGLCRFYHTHFHSSLFRRKSLQTWTLESGEIQLSHRMCSVWLCCSNGASSHVAQLDCPGSHVSAVKHDARLLLRIEQCDEYELDVPGIRRTYALGRYVVDF